MLGVSSYLNNGYARPGARGLVLPLPGDPGLEALEGPPQRPNLPHPAALLVSVLVEREEALAPHKVLHLAGLWEHVLDVDTVVLLHLVEEFVCLWVQPPRVKAEHPEGASGQLRVFDEGHVLGTTAQSRVNPHQ